MIESTIPLAKILTTQVITHTSHVKIVRAPAGIDLSKLGITHDIYKEVKMDQISAGDGLGRITELINGPPLYRTWVKIVAYGFASAFVGPFAFGTRFIDMPICFCLGVMIGILQTFVASRFISFSKIFEVIAPMLTAFLARAFGSIQPQGLFCYSGIAQSAIVFVLPGYILVCGALELQAKNLVAGSVRMFQAIMYSPFGTTLGSALYALVDKNATNQPTCNGSVSDYHRLWIVPIFSLCLVVVFQAHYRQAPAMIIIASIGYLVNYSASSSFVIATIGNLYSRIGHGLAFTAVLPAVLVLVPSGLAAQGGLLSGLHEAQSIVKNSTTLTVSDSIFSISDTNMLYFVFQMIKVSIGITVGLFLSAVFIYPIPWKRSIWNF
ncbi:Uncharacterized UPF0442 protein [Neolecta irregularis DAH-3]|uniref:Uncharacterized UPF0442 protein n=1 Tax=Neolecta irregularis (strain DAH-3) TaxID=1198029 RepID=A0A1U7LHZ4_NEOID|nr:Uncharacterized UPF0442 protein [Neolecta irregularis DAH-3]|eukprot:OLL22280.1 Uncharacterized UPF0442 protein [Neolecta irregularis DAH-3]